MWGSFPTTLGLEKLCDLGPAGSCAQLQDAPGEV